jgi:hypothetical protein
MQILNRTRLYEIIAAALTGIGKVVFINLIDLRLPYIILTILGWLGYVIYRYRQQPEILKYWGLGTDNFRKSFLQLLPLVLVCMALFVGIGFYFQTEVLDWSLLLMLLLYPIWGILQQFLVLGIYSRNLADGWGGQRSEPLVIGLTAVLFAIIHYPSPMLIGATFLLAIVYTWLFLRGSSILALGIYHGWLGGIFFYTVLGRNPWLEAFGAG